MKKKTTSIRKSTYSKKSRRTSNKATDHGGFCHSQVSSADLKVHPSLKNYFGYCLYKVAMKYKALMDDAILAFGISTTQIGILRVLLDMGDMSQNDLGSGMGIDKASMAKWIDQLDRQKFVIRRAHQEDRRIKTVSITSSGKILIGKVAIIRKKIENEFLMPLTYEEQKVIRAAIPKLLGSEIL